MCWSTFFLNFPLKSDRACVALAGMIKPNAITVLEHQISSIVPTTGEKYQGPQLCQIYPQTCLPTGISLGYMGPHILEYCLLLYCYEGNAKNVPEMRKKVSDLIFQENCQK